MRSIGNILGKGASYNELLNREEWRSFARNVRGLRNNACESCKRGNVELHVHHFAYDGNKKPWEYSVEDVAVLCRDCHKQLHDGLQKFRRYVFRKMTPRSLEVLNGALAVGLEFNDPLLFAYAVAEMAASRGSVRRFSEAFDEMRKQVS